MKLNRCDRKTLGGNEIRNGERCGEKNQYLSHEKHCHTKRAHQKLDRKLVCVFLTYLRVYDFLLVSICTNGFRSKNGLNRWT